MEPSRITRNDTFIYLGGFCPDDHNWDIHQNGTADCVRHTQVDVFKNKMQDTIIFIILLNSRCGHLSVYSY
jgi:hypothetical protein